MTAYLGITGLPGSGKSTTARLVAEYLGALGFRVLNTSLSEELRIRLGEVGVPHPGRQELTSYANSLREKHGAGVLAHYVLERANRTILQNKQPIHAVVIDSVRNPAEVIEFRRELGTRFRLLAVLSPPECIKHRLVSSGLEMSQIPHIDAMLASELGETNPNYGVKVADCIALADWTIENSTSTLQLKEQVESLVSQRLLPTIVLGQEQ